MQVISKEMEQRINTILDAIVLERIELYPSTVNVMGGITDLGSYVNVDLLFICNDERQHIIGCFKRI